MPEWYEKNTTLVEPESWWEEGTELISKPVTAMPEFTPRQYESFHGELGRAIAGGSMQVAGGLSGLLGKFFPQTTRLIDEIETEKRGRIVIKPPEEGILDKWARQLYHKAHEPAYAPGQKGGVKGFVANAVGRALPYMAAATGATLLTGTPWAAFTVGFAAEGEDAYRTALETGASERQAELERLLVGTINGALEQMQIHRLFRFAKGGGRGTFKQVATLARQKAWKKLGKQAGKFGLDVFQLSINEGIEEALQETVSALVPSLHGKPLPSIEELGKRVGQAGLGGMVAGGILGAGGRIIAPTETTQPIIPIEDIELPHGIETAEGFIGIPLEEVDIESPQDKLSRVIKEARRLSPAEQAKVRTERREELGRRVGEAEEAYRRNTPEALWQALYRLKGKLPKGLLSFREDFTLEEQNDLRYQIRDNPDLNFFDKVDCERALLKLLAQDMPTQHEISLLEKQFGETFAKDLMKLQSASIKAHRIFGEITNLPRTLCASVDVSYPGRQGIRWLPRHPVIWGKSVGAAYKSFFSPNVEAASHQLENTIKTGPYFGKGQQHKLDWVEWEGASRTFLERPEPYMSDYAQKIPYIGPLVKRSAAAYAIGGNKLRNDIWSYYCEQAEGQNQPDIWYDQLADFINNSTGRPKLKKFGAYAPALNAVFFAPRFTKSLIVHPMDLASPTKLRNIGKIMWAEAASFVGGGLLALYLMSLIPGVSIEKDPRSSDFGKIRYGDTRIDFWGGFSPLARLVTQLITGERKASDTGVIYGVDAREVITQFVRGKLSPIGGLVSDIFTRRTFEGKPVEFDQDTIMREFWNLFVPFSIRDTSEALYHQGLVGGAIAAPLAFHGIGVQTYPISPGKQSRLVKDGYAREVFGQRWDDIGSDAQKLLRQIRPQIEMQEIKTKSERENVAFLDRMAIEQRKSASRLYLNLPSNTRTELERLYINENSFPGFSRRIATNWFLNDDRYKEYQTMAKSYLNKLLPMILNHNIYRSLDDTAKREVILEAVDKAKKQARENIVDKANVEDLITLQTMLNK